MNRRRFIEYLLLFVFSVATAVSVIRLSPPTSAKPIEARSLASRSVYDRVLKGGVIRCGYATYPPSFIKDPNTGKASGIFVELAERMAHDLGLRIEWVEEVGWASMIEGLQTDRYDLLGSGVWANSTRGKAADFTIPLYYNGIGVYVRSNDPRFSKGMEGVDIATLRIATIDGEISDIIAQQEFPRAQRVSLPQLTDNSQMMLNVVQGRADMTFAEAQAGHQFLKANPNALMNLAATKPVRIFPATMMLKKGEYAFKTMLDSALQELLNSGFVERVIRKYAGEPTDFYLVAHPYRPLTTASQP